MSPPLLARFTARHPGLEAHFILSDAGLEVEADACDLVLRFGLPTDEGMIARKIASTNRILCAASNDHGGAGGRWALQRLEIRTEAVDDGGPICEFITTSFLETCADADEHMRTIRKASAVKPRSCQPKIQIFCALGGIFLRQWRQAGVYPPAPFISSVTGSWNLMGLSGNRRAAAFF